MISKEVLLELYKKMGISRISEQTGETYDEIRHALNIHGVRVYDKSHRRNPNPTNSSVEMDPYYKSPYVGFTEAVKRAARAKSCYQCAVCHIKESELRRKLDVHHIDRNKRNNAPSNLVAICQSCHMKLGSHRVR